MEAKIYVKVQYIVDEASGCWVWQGYKSIDGYGRKRYNGTAKMAHRVFFEIYKGAIPEGLKIDHLCRNRACVNPDHLEPVSDAVNTQRSTVARLTLEQVEEIRERYSTGIFSYRALASMYSVSKGCIDKILTNRSWTQN